MLNGLKQLTLILLVRTQEAFQNILLPLVLPFIVNSVTICCGMPPFALVFPLNRLAPSELLMLTSAPFSALLLVSVTLTSINHLTVRLFFSVSMPGGPLATNAILLLLKLTFVNTISVAFEVKIISK